MIDLHITGVGFAERMLLQYPRQIDAVVSIGNPGSKIPKGFSKVPFSLRLEMEDLWKVNEIHKYRSQGKRAPGREDVERVVEFARRLKGDERLLVHCHAGISRSTAVAWIILHVRGFPGASEKETLDHILKVRPPACPNKILMAYADELLGAKFLDAMNTDKGGIWLG